MKKPTFDSVDDYLNEKHLYQLGMLPTEKQNEHTLRLSQWIKQSPLQAIQAVQEVDIHALQMLSQYGEAFARLSQEIHQTLASGRRIFLCGCGATGRLSLANEAFWRFVKKTDQVTGFMAGGDIALVRSVENFEDMPNFGSKHLLDLGFQKGDLLISTTEGGETPFVIGATEKAAEVAQKEGGRKPYFLYCNPDDILSSVERSRHVMESSFIHCISIPTGPMALSGSTRLQASTVLKYGVGLALLHAPLSAQQFTQMVRDFTTQFQKTALDFLVDFSSFEAETIRRGDYVLYETDTLGITILTDTTERSPTFSLRPFESLLDPPSVKPCWSYLSILGAEKSEDAWRAILGREPYGLDWEEYREKLNKKAALAFDFSRTGALAREERTKPHRLERIRILDNEKELTFHYGNREHRLPCLQVSHGSTSLLERHLLLKLVLNTHSLLMMGLLDRFEGNVMTWVRPSNGKLIDRSIRYIQFLLHSHQKTPSYEEVARRIFELRPKLGEDEPIVLKVVHSFL